MKIYMRIYNYFVYTHLIRGRSNWHSICATLNGYDDGDMNHFRLSKSKALITDYFYGG